jgi:transforming growth factor-beta-induced protein
LTLFAPMNSAFDGIDTTALTDQQLTDILLYHVVPGVVPYTALLTTGSLPTLSPGGGTIAVVVAADGRILVNGNPVLIANQFANNGMVHVIDQVLIPPAGPEKCPPPYYVRRTG